MAKKDKKKKINTKKQEKKYSRFEKDLNKTRKKMFKVMAKLGKRNVQDYTLKDSNGNDVKLSQLFKDKKDLILIHNMGKECKYCTLWADGFNGTTYFIEQAAAFALVSPDPPAVQKKFAAERGWTFPMYSGEGSAFIKDMGFQTKDGKYQPGVSAFHKENGKITRESRAYFGPGDFFCHVWYFFDMLPGKRDYSKL